MVLRLWTIIVVLAIAAALPFIMPRRVGRPGWWVIACHLPVRLLLRTCHKRIAAQPARQEAGQ